MHSLDAALADPTRRAILARLAKGEATANERAKPFEMTQPAVSQHLKVLEDAGLIAFAESKAQDALVVPPTPVSKLWTNGWQCCARPLRKTMTGWTEFWPESKDERRRKMMSKMTLRTEGDTHIIVTRRFAAPPETVYRAHTDPRLIQKWLLGPEGWSMAVCVNEARPGGKFRFEWTNGKGGGFYLTGKYLQLEPNSRIVHVERMYLPDPTPDNHVETRFDPDGKGTLMTMRMTLPDAQTRAAMLATGMERGMEASYVRLEGML
jgi:uncharacterized protein YndB with AHSA1/START domain